MGSTLSGNTVLIFGAEKDLYAWPILQAALNSDGTKAVALKTDASGNLLIATGIGAGDATAANQATQITAEQAILAKLPVAGAATINAGYSSQVSVTRPANTTPYTAGDVVGGVITFPLAGPAAGYINLNDADLRIDVSAVPAGMANMRLQLYNATPPSALADNAPWDLPSGDRASYLGYVDIGTPTDIGSTLYIQTGGSGYKEILMGATTNLFGYLQTIGAFTPAGNSEVYTARINSRGL